MSEVLNVASALALCFDGAPPTCSQPPPLDDAWFRQFAGDLDVLSGQLHALLAQREFNSVELHLTTPAGTISDAFFYGDEVPELLREPARRFVDAVTRTAEARGREIWATAETNLGEPAAQWLAKTSVDDVVRFVRWLERACDLDHEVDHIGHISEIVRAHGWTRETIVLWVARNTTCAGQWGAEQGWEALTSQSVEDWAAASSDNRSFVVRVLTAALLALQPAAGERAQRIDRLNDDVEAYFSLLAGAGLGSLSTAIIDEVVARATAQLEHQPPGDWLDAAVNGLHGAAVGAQR